MRDYVRECLKSGEASVHIVTDLVSRLEEELEAGSEDEDATEKDSVANEEPHLVG